ncbi:AraC family transcriptional regulator [Sesbania bispinosa]|nr:AraC family transcriptional regulator [Sesbania bispinosa]
MHKLERLAQRTAKLGTLERRRDDGSDDAMMRVTGIAEAANKRGWSSLQGRPVGNVDRRRVGVNGGRRLGAQLGLVREGIGNGKGF